MKQKLESFEEWIQDYLKGARNKGRERGKINQRRDRRERKEEKWGEREVEEIDSPWTHSKVTDNMTKPLFLLFPWTFHHCTLLIYLADDTHLLPLSYPFKRKNTLHVVMSSFCFRTILCDTVWEDKTKHNNNKTPIHTFVCPRKSLQDGGGKTRAQLFSKVLWFAFNLIEPFHPRMEAIAKSLELDSLTPLFSKGRKSL